MRHLLMLTASLAAFLFAAHAKASPMTYNISFTASPYGPASGSYTLTFDPTKTYGDTTAGLTVNSFSDTFTPPTSIGFNYGVVTPGELVIGGTMSGVGTIVSGTNDYFLAIINFPTAPQFELFAASSASSSSDAINDSKGTVTVTNMAATPEPSSFALLGTGLIGVAGVLRKRLA